MTFMAANDLREELQATLDQMARVYAARDAAACAALFAEHASLYSPYAPPAHRRTEIEALHREWTQHATSKRFEILDFGGSGEIAWAVAKYSEGTATGRGTTLAVFERGPDTRWLIRVCSLNETED